MHWEILIIPLIALGVYIFSALFKNEDDKTKKGVGRRPPFAPQTGGGRGGSRAPGRRVVVTDLDRFLEEARRRREPEERRQAPPPPPSHAPAALPPLRERPTRPQEPPRLATPLSPPASFGGGKGAAEEAIVALPVPPPLAPPPPAAEPVAGPRSAREAPPLAVPPTPSNPIAQQVRSLLSKPQTAATAFVLREIFDRPLCKRRR